MAKTAKPKKVISFTGVVKKPKPQITFWSYSRFRDYQKCPLATKLKHLDKINEPANDAMTRGGEIGKQAEGYIKGAFRTLAPELKGFTAEFKEFRALYKKLNSKPPEVVDGQVVPPRPPKPGQPRKPYRMTVEDTWAFTKDWTQTTWNDWINCWVRIKVDCAHEVANDTLIVTDFKTGKFRPEEIQSYIEQLELYSLGALLTHPLIKVVKARLMYTDAGVIYPDKSNCKDLGSLTFTQADVPKLKALWDKRVRAMLLDKSFAPRPNDKCRWCWYGQSSRTKGGPGLCKF